MKSLCGLLVLSLLVTLANARSLGALADTHTYVYGLLIDAGSSGSRIYTYAWLQRIDTGLPDLTTAPVNQTAWSSKISPGLGTFANNLDGIANYLKPLIDYALAHLNASDVPNTVLFLKATGGLRALPQSDQDNIMEKTRAYFRTTPFNFTDSRASVITLNQESLYGWMTVNYLLKTFSTPGETYGALDMGGATTEIAFIPADSSPKAFNTTLTLNSRQYNVYTGGYAARGLDTALLLTNQYLAAQNATSPIVWSPCYLKDYNESATYGANTYTIVGYGNTTECRALASTVLLDTTVECSVPPCAFNGVYQPALHGNFYAYSGYFYTYDALFPLHGAITIQDFIAASETLCGQAFADARAAHPTIALNFLKNYCFTSSYFIQLWHVFGFTDSSTITFSGTINNAEVSWALGGMLYEANLLPIEIIPPPTPTTTTTNSATTSATTGAATTGGSTGTTTTTTTTAKPTSAPVSSIAAERYQPMMMLISVFIALTVFIMMMV